MQVRGFIWELTFGYSFRIHHFLVRQRIHVSASPRGYVEEFHTFFPRVLGPRIPRSMLGAVHTWKSGVLLQAPHIWQSCQSMVAFGRIPRISHAKVTLDPEVWTTGIWSDSAENRAGAAVAVHRRSTASLGAAEANPHGPACSENHRDSAVAVGQVVDAPVVQVVPFVPTGAHGQTLQKTVEVPQMQLFCGCGRSCDLQ